MYQPGRRETGGERATQRPFWGAPGGDPAAPNAQRPTPNGRRWLALGCTYRHHRYGIVKCSNGAPKRAIEHPVKWPRRRPAPRGRPCRTQRPTPNAQRPNTQRSPIASPTVHLPRLSLCRRDVLERGFKTCYRSPRKVTSSSTSAAGATLPHPTPNAQHPTPNARR